ncbi:hypothetical protein AMTRI_Chr12g270710 [Amborella trichopoda]
MAISNLRYPLALYLCDLFLPLVLDSIFCSFGMCICDPLAFHCFP